MIYFEKFKTNLLKGISYYKQLLPELVEESQKYRDQMMLDFQTYASELEQLLDENEISVIG